MVRKGNRHDRWSSQTEDSVCAISHVQVDDYSIWKKFRRLLNGSERFDSSPMTEISSRSLNICVMPRRRCVLHSGAPRWRLAQSGSLPPLSQLGRNYANASVNIGRYTRPILRGWLAATKPAVTKSQTECREKKCVRALSLQEITIVVCAPIGSLSAEDSKLTR